MKKLPIVYQREKQTCAQKELIFPNIKEVQKPVERPWLQGWSVSLDEMHETLPDGTYTLNQLDVSISPDAYVEAVNKGKTQEELTHLAMVHYPKACPHDCPGCFERKVITRNPLMATEEVYDMLKEAKELGLKNIKFLGPGELVQNKRLFEILDFLKENDINIAIFTKGIALGSDKWAKKFHKLTAQDFCDKIAGYPNVTILVGATSMNPCLEEEKLASPLVPDIFEVRNQAVKNLYQAGMADDPEQRRMALIMAPILNDNIDEALDMFSWALERNIPTVMTPTMISGRGNDMPEVKDEVFKKEKLVDLYAEVYVNLIRSKIMSLQQVEDEGISPYPGYACNQFTGGMFIRKDGTVQACPGNDREDFTYAPDVRKQSLKEIWVNSLGYRIRKQLIQTGKMTLTQPCYAKSEGIKMPDGKVLVKKGEGSIPERFYEKVLETVREKLQNV